MPIAIASAAPMMIHRRFDRATGAAMPSFGAGGTPISVPLSDGVSRLVKQLVGATRRQLTADGSVGVGQPQSQAEGVGMLAPSLPQTC